MIEPATTAVILIVLAVLGWIVAGGRQWRMRAGLVVIVLLAFLVLKLTNTTPAVG